MDLLLLSAHSLAIVIIIIMSGFYVPFQSFLPLAIVGGALFAAGPILLTTHRLFNNGKVSPKTRFVYRKEEKGREGRR